MVSCEILDWRCIFVNELFGSVTLTVIFSFIFYLMIAGKLKFGSETTIALAFPVVILGSLMVGGFNVVYAFATIIVALMVAFVFQRVVGIR